MKKQSSHKRKIFSCLALFFVLVGVGGSSQAASRKLYFALANNFDSQCAPDYQAINQSNGALANFNYAKTAKTKSQGNISDQNLPNFGVNSTFFTSRANLQETNCNGYMNQNYQANLHSQIYEISEWKAHDSQGSLINNSIEETQASKNESISEIPVPGAIWLFSSVLIGMFGLGKRKPVKV